MSGFASCSKPTRSSGTAIELLYAATPGRYDLLVVNGWTVLRFAWEDVMHEQT